MEMFWDIFEKSGNIEAYLGFKEFEKIENRSFNFLNRDTKPNVIEKRDFGI